MVRGKGWLASGRKEQDELNLAIEDWAYLFQRHRKRQTLCVRDERQLQAAVLDMFA